MNSKQVCRDVLALTNVPGVVAIERIQRPAHVCNVIQTMSAMSAMKVTTVRPALFAAAGDGGPLRPADQGA